MKIETNRMGKISTLSLLAAMTLAGGDALALAWDGGASTVNWEDALNWADDGLPDNTDLAFIADNTIGAVLLNSNQTIDALRTANGRDLTHTGGTLTVAGTGNLTSLIGEKNEASVTLDGASIYTMSGSARYEQQDGKFFIMGQNAEGQLLMSDNAVMTSTALIVFGNNANFSGEVSGNAKIETTNNSSMQMARISSPSSSLTFKDNASLQVDGFFVMSDNAANSGDSTLRLEGSSLDIDVDGFFMRENATLEFIADAGGISTIDLGGPHALVDNGGGLNPQLVVDLSLYSGTGPITLIDNTTLDPINGQFRGLAEGVTVPGTGGRTISYLGGDGNDVVLSINVQAVPGDTDGDGDVDDADLAASFSNFTGPLDPDTGGKTLAQGDVDGDGDVDDGDLAIQFSNFTGPLAPAVPEPASLALLGLGGLLVARRRRA